MTTIDFLDGKPVSVENEEAFRADVTLLLERHRAKQAPRQDQGWRAGQPHPEDRQPEGETTD